LSETLIQFKNVIKLAPYAITAHMHLGNLYLQQAEQSEQPVEEALNQAIAHYQQALDGQPEHLEALNNLGVAWLKKNALLTAMHYFAKVLQIDEAHIPARSNLAAGFLNQAQYIQAIHHYKTLIDLDATNIEAHYNLGTAFMNIGQLNNAIEQFQKTLQLHPDNLAAHLNLGAIFLKLQQSGQAIQHYQAVLQQQPDHPTASYMLNAITQKALPEAAPKAYIQDLFDSYADNYDQHMQETLQYQVPAYIQQTIAENTSSTQLLITDLGCGSGLVGSAIKPYCQYLTGIDLSSKMLAQARAKGIYDELLQADIISALADKPATADILIAAEVFIYNGNLQPLLTACWHALRTQGLLIFTTEINQDQPYRLQTHGRFTHSLAYLQQIARETGFIWINAKIIPIRLHNEQMQSGYLITLKKLATSNLL
jgi:predicted TPR repeat methyltransferase